MSLNAPDNSSDAVEVAGLEDRIGRLWQTYGQLAPQDIPEEARASERQCILDWVGCALAGSREPLVKILREESLASGALATVIGGAAKVSAKDAALVNGSAGHSLDFDDTNLVGGFHATATVVPAALAIAEELGLGGAELLTACIVGTEISCRLRVVIGEAHYGYGWHTTGTVGIFGATAAVAWLLRLDRDQFRCAVGLAASQAGGLHANFGTMAKPFHAGHAAERGLLSARLASRGMTANADAVSAFFRQTGGQDDWDAIADLGDRWAVVDTLFKQFASGAGTQAAIDAAQRSGAVADQVIRAEVHISPEFAASAYGVRFPTNSLEAKFSLPGVTALIFLGFDLQDPASFRDEVIRSSAFVDLVSRIQLVGDTDFSFSAFEAIAGCLVVETPAGIRRTSFRPMRDSGPVESRYAMLRSKFETLTSPIIGTASDTLGNYLLELESVGPISEVTRLLRVN